MITFLLSSDPPVLQLHKVQATLFTPPP